MVARLVVFDTNALLLPFTEGTDLQAELERLLGTIEWIVPSSILAELQLLSRGTGAAAQGAKAALRYGANARIEKTGLPGDDGLLEVARRLEAVVVSNDRHVQNEAARSGLVVVVARGKGRLALRGSGGVG